MYFYVVGIVQFRASASGDAPLTEFNMLRPKNTIGTEEPNILPPAGLSEDRLFLMTCIYDLQDNFTLNYIGKDNNSDDPSTYTTSLFPVSTKHCA